MKRKITWGKTVQTSRCPLPMESHRTCLIPQPHIVTTCVIWWLPGKFIWDSVPRAFIGAWSRRHPLPSVYQDTSLPEGKQFIQYSINCIVCTNSLDTMKLLSGRVVRILPKCKFPDASHQPTSQAGLLKGSSQFCYVNSLLYSMLYKQTCTKVIPAVLCKTEKKLAIYGMCLLIRNEYSNLAIFIQWILNCRYEWLELFAANMRRSQRCNVERKLIF